MNGLIISPPLTFVCNTWWCDLIWMSQLRHAIDSFRGKSSALDGWDELVALRPEATRAFLLLVYLDGFIYMNQKVRVKTGKGSHSMFERRQQLQVVSATPDNIQIRNTYIYLQVVRQAGGIYFCHPRRHRHW